MNRTALSKKTRFEVFKRDSFTCQYCGKKAPDVVLEVDHIEPVSKGGDNDLFNLITSCKDCNRGKSNIKINDNTVIEKQRQQMEEVQERREQIEMLFKWRESLKAIDDDTLNLLIEYINGKIKPINLNENGIAIVEKLFPRFDINQILDAVDISAKQYLKYDSGNQPTTQSAMEFIEKIGGIIVVKNKTPVEQKCAYIKGICKNRFNYWDVKKGSLILNNYVKALRDYGWSEERILEDLEGEVSIKTKSCSNWSEWRQLLEKWTSDIYKWEKNQEQDECEAYDLESLKEMAESIFINCSGILQALKYIGAAWEEYDEIAFDNNYYSGLKLFFDILKNWSKNGSEQMNINYLLLSDLGFLDQFYRIDSILKNHLHDGAVLMMKDLLTDILGDVGNLDGKDIEIIECEFEYYLNKK